LAPASLAPKRALLHAGSRLKKSGRRGCSIGGNSSAAWPALPSRIKPAGQALIIVPEYKDPLRFDRLANDLAHGGWAEGRVDKLLGANFAHRFAEVWDAP
jgi:hypothetical protein